MFDVLIVGAGLSGSVFARELAEAGHSILIVDKRAHIAGTVFDEYDDAGILVQRYGAHIFHTNSLNVYAYLSRYTQWRHYEHRVLASVDGQLVPFPINLDTLNQLYRLDMHGDTVKGFLESRAEPRERIVTAEDAVVSKVGRDLYEKFYQSYTRRHWGIDPSELDAQVTNRIPVRTNRDDRYFTDTYQGIPRFGYTKMIAKMLDHPNIHVLLNTQFVDIAGEIEPRALVWTGPIDEYFQCYHGELPYRSIRFDFQTFDRSLVQPVATINYPNDREYIRSTEFKHLTGQQHAKTTIVFEYPSDEGEPLYPVPTNDSAGLYAKYVYLAEKLKNVYFAGRLGTYHYWNMDQVVANALKLSAKVASDMRL